MEDKMCFIEVSRITEDLLNARVVGNETADRELRDSITVNGIIQSLIVRPVADGLYEVVCGHRRLRAAVDCEIESLPCIVRNLNDEQARRTQLVENLQREGLDPIDEGTAMRNLIHGSSAEDVAAEVGKSVTYCLQRARLADLSPKGKASFREGKIGLSAALQMARLPLEMQDDVLKSLKTLSGGELGIGSKKVAQVIERDYMRSLANAPFKSSDEKLVVTAGGCNKCPKRTGNQRELFDDVKKKDICTDTKCFRSKLDAHFKIAAGEHKKAGGIVMAKAEAKDLFNEFGGGAILENAVYCTLDYIGWITPTGKSLGAVLEEADIKLEPCEIVLAQNPFDGMLNRLIDAKLAKSLLKKVSKAEKPVDSPKLEEKKTARAGRLELKAAKEAASRSYVNALSKLESDMDRQRFPSHHSAAELCLGILLTAHRDYTEALQDELGLELPGENMNAEHLMEQLFVHHNAAASSTPSDIDARQNIAIVTFAYLLIGNDVKRMRGTDFPSSLEWLCKITGVEPTSVETLVREDAARQMAKAADKDLEGKVKEKKGKRNARKAKASQDVV